MRVRKTIRRYAQGGFLAPLCFLPLLFTPILAQAHGQQEVQAPAPIERRSPPPSAGRPATTSTSANYPLIAQQEGAPTHHTQSSLPRGEHLAQWMTQHSNLTPEQQQQALGREPGFNTLSSETQQRYRDRLAQLDALNPEKRQRFLARTEVMERLTPEQRAEVRGAMGQLGALPADQRRVVARTFRALRDLPPSQRVQALNAGRFGPPLDPAQRAVMSGLLRVEPMLPPPARPQTTPMVPGTNMVPGAPQYGAPR